MHPLHGLGIKRFGLLVTAELGGGDGEAHLVVDGGGEVVGGLGVAVGAGRVQRLARGAADLAGGGAADQLGEDDGEEIDQGADGGEHHQDDPDPEDLLARTHHVDAHPDEEGHDRDEARQAEGEQQAHSGAPLDPWRGSAFSAGARRITSVW